MAGCRRCEPVVATALAPAVAVLLIFLASFTKHSFACTSGVLQLNPPPTATPYDPCRNSWVDRNSLKAVCGPAFKVTAAGNLIRMVPLETASFNYSGPGPYPPAPPFNCKDHNASGLLRAGSTTAATVMLYDDLGGPLSNLTRTGPSQVSLAVAHTYSYKGPPVSCTYNYSVVSGCVLGAKPRASAYTCPPGHITKTGRYGLKYCAMCPRGTYSPGGAAGTCRRCPVGTANNFLGASSCRPCNMPGEYAAVEGLEYCQYCSTYDNKWTDGKSKCEACPANSVPSPTKRNQCVRCYEGKKCCTVNWDKDCPKCTRSDKPKTHTSIFALESTTPAACMASTYALCTPRINITIDGTCMITFSNMDYQNSPDSNTYCSWQNALPIKGAAARALTDLAKLEQYSWQSTSLLAGNVTAVSSPYLDINVKAASCTFRYRALTKPAATILGAAPKAAPAAPCPPGRYIETVTDTKPGPCLPCPPGTFSTRPGTTRACTPCPAGTYSRKYGSTACSRCPAGRVSAAGAASCSFCQQWHYSYGNADRASCSLCPPNTGIAYPGLAACLGRVGGNTCCAAGACGSQAPCGKQQLVPRDNSYTSFQAVFRLVSRSLGSATCRNATFLSCLRPGASVALSSYSLGHYVTMDLTKALTTCATNSSYILSSLYGDIAATNRALLGSFAAPVGDHVNYELLSNAAARTFTMYLSPATGYRDTDKVGPVPLIRKECSATFQLVSGAFLDIQPPPAAACPPGAVTTTYQGRKLCRFCGMGYVGNANGGCRPCPRGTYQPLFAGTVCRSCPVGHSCYEGSHTPSPCTMGSFGPKTRLPSCLQCPAGTYTGHGPHKACIKCPAGTIAPKASSACGMPWLKKF